MWPPKGDEPRRAELGEGLVDDTCEGGGVVVTVAVDKTGSDGSASPADDGDEELLTFNSEMALCGAVVADDVIPNPEVGPPMMKPGGLEVEFNGDCADCGNCTDGDRILSFGLVPVNGRNANPVMELSGIDDCSEESCNAVRPTNRCCTMV